MPDHDIIAPQSERYTDLWRDHAEPGRVRAYGLAEYRAAGLIYDAESPAVGARPSGIDAAAFDRAQWWALLIVVCVIVWAGIFWVAIHAGDWIREALR